MPTIAHYEILEKLGEGGMGVVWKARDPRLERFVALKLLPAAKTADPERRRRFAQEARAASALNHPNIVTIYDINRADDTDFIAMEYIAGKTLDQLIPKKGLRVSEALKYAIQIADALAAAHVAGIVHRDLKPGNVMVSESGLVKVLDFGLAKLIEEGEVGESDHTRTIAMEAPRTEEGAILGTASYMSPEQAEGKKIDARSDIFSFGALLYEMLTGRRAFQGDSQMSTLAAILNREPAPLEAQTEGVPRELTRIVMRCLRKDLARRSQSLAELKLALEELKEDSDSGATAAPGTTRRARGRLPLLAATLILLAAVAGGTYRFWPGSTKPETPLGVSPLTTFPGYEQHPSFSPDGSQIAFSWNGEKGDNYDIYVQLIGSGGPLRLTTDPRSDLHPAWSPDGKFITFVRQDAEGEYSILSIPPLGGGEREVAQLGKPPAMILGWTPDGRRLLVSLKEASQPFGLFVVSADTGEKRRLTSGKGIGDTVAGISPDGGTIAFGRTLNTSVGVGATGELYTLPLTPDFSPSAEPKRLTSDDSWIRGLAWTGDGKEIVFSSEQNGSTALWRIASSGSEKPRRLTVGESAGSLAISPRANRLVYELVIPSDTNIWRKDLSNPSLPPASFIASTRIEGSPQYSLDGRRIAFRSARSGADEIWACDADGTNATQLTRRSPSGSPRWSPDSRRIVYDSHVNGKWQIFTMAAQGGQPLQLTIEASNTRPSWSHDGKWVYFGSGRSGRAEVWKAPSGGGNAVQVTRNGGSNPVESGDGSALYYDSHNTIMRAALDGSGETRVTDGVASGYGEWALRPDGIYYRAQKPPTEIRFFSFATQTVRQVWKSDTLTNSLAVSPDGRYLLYTQVDGQPGSDLMLVENFH